MLIHLNNPKIISFFENKKINIEDVLLLFIDFYEKNNHKLNFEESKDILLDKINQLHYHLLQKDNDNIEIVKNAIETQLNNNKLLLDTNNKLLDTQNNIQNIISKFENSNKKGIMSQNCLYTLLINSYKQYNIINTSNLNYSCDIKIEMDNYDLYFENKDYTNNIPTEEIKKFYRDINFLNKTKISHGVFISQNSGICKKNNFDLDIITLPTNNQNDPNDNNEIDKQNYAIILFITDLKYNIDKIDIALNIINYLHDTINYNKVLFPKTYNINTEMLKTEINTLINQQDEIMKIVNNFKKDITNKVKNLTIPGKYIQD
jgi:hypothetical protein